MERGKMKLCPSQLVTGDAENMEGVSSNSKWQDSLEIVHSVTTPIVTGDAEIMEGEG